MWLWLALFFGFSTSVSIAISKKALTNMHPLVWAAASGTAYLPLIWLAVLLSGGPPVVDRIFFTSLLVSASIGTVASLASFWAIKTSPVSQISPLSAFNPLFTTLISSFSLREFPNWYQLAGILAIVTGSYFIQIQRLTDGLLSPFFKLYTNPGVRLFILANFIWSITPILEKTAIQHTTPVMPIFAAFVSNLMIVLFQWLLIAKLVPHPFGQIKQNIWWIVLPAPISAMSLAAAFTAFSLAPLSLVTAIFKSSVLFTIIWGWLFFKEEHIKQRLLAGLIMIVGVLLLAM